jgi:hypothetical protein
MPVLTGGTFRSPRRLIIQSGGKFRKNWLSAFAIGKEFSASVTDHRMVREPPVLPPVCRGGALAGHPRIGAIEPECPSCMTKGRERRPQRQHEAAGAKRSGGDGIEQRYEFCWHRHTRRSDCPFADRGASPGKRSRSEIAAAASRVRGCGYRHSRMDRGPGTPPQSQRCTTVTSEVRRSAGPGSAIRSDSDRSRP